ncbi:putative deoxyribonuclease TATDN2 [Trichonephila clavata]|uniref:Putative deoxyribonuclease TATDN2 n=1 Tax=Trichonephila clavata TaxID=2740835 RepID=A0A8X6KBX6_TRICU|nr:putative deoxyribonuclease TATDN2 [Trichonephila clavata]
MCGLYVRNYGKCPREIQKKVFRRQLRIGYSKQLPLVIHCRKAHEDCIRILLETIPNHYTFHLHCFAENWYWADRWLKTFPNVYIGITNLVTFASRDDLREVAARIPLDRLLLETDAPYCKPKSEHKRRNNMLEKVQYAVLKTELFTDYLLHSSVSVLPPLQMVTLGCRGKLCQALPNQSPTLY